MSHIYKCTVWFISLRLIHQEWIDDLRHKIVDTCDQGGQMDRTLSSPGSSFHHFSHTAVITQHYEQFWYKPILHDF